MLEVIYKSRHGVTHELTFYTVDELIESMEREGYQYKNVTGDHENALMRFRPTFHSLEGPTLQGEKLVYEENPLV